jgi:NAD(P)-dependent dehydrogenase (short-subunit alcohol dehydrogenase family)
VGAARPAVQQRGRGFKAATIDETPVEEWLDVVAVNLRGASWRPRGFAQMRRQEPEGGRIINNGR